MRIKENDIENEKNILKIKDFTVFNQHICIVTELLEINLYDLMHLNNFEPIPMNYIQTFAPQILTSLVFL